MEEKQYPLIGPATYEEAISRIEAAEKEIEDGKGTPKADPVCPRGGRGG